MSQTRHYMEIEFSDGSTRLYDTVWHTCDLYHNDAIEKASAALLKRFAVFGRDNRYANPKVPSTRQVTGPTPARYREWIAESALPPEGLEWKEYQNPMPLGHLFRGAEENCSYRMENGALCNQSLWSH